MIKLVAGTIAAIVLGLGGVAAAQTFTGDDSIEPRSVSVGTTTNDDTVGTTTLETTTTGEDEVEDIPGPCDEAEHANDPRCTGTGTVDDRDDDDRRRGRGDDGDDRRGHNGGHGGGGEDRSGSNSGRG